MFASSCISVECSSSVESKIMWYDKYDADEYLNKEEAVDFLSEVVTEFHDRRQNDIELKVNISGACKPFSSSFICCSGSESSCSPGCLCLRLLFHVDDLQSLRV